MHATQENARHQTTFNGGVETTFNIAIQYRYRLRMLDDIVIVHRARVL